MKAVGIDVGSTVTKLAVWDGSGIRFQSKSTLDFLTDPVMPETERVVSTGYGRRRVKSDQVIPEIRAHVLGALEQLDLRDFILLDVGGQDFKVIRVRNGILDDFIMNDRCAAGTGRFLERMAAQLHMTLPELGSHWMEPTEISSVCTVFAETEVVTRMMDGASRESLAAGVNRSLYMRIRPSLGRFMGSQLVLSGGGVTIALERILVEEGFDISTLPMPMHNGALGCLALARKMSDPRRQARDLH